MLTKSSSKVIRQGVSHTDGKTYLLAHNRAWSTVEAGLIPLVNTKGSPIGAFNAKPVGNTAFAKPDAVKGTGSLSLSLGPEEIALYELEGR